VCARFATEELEQARRGLVLPAWEVPNSRRGFKGEKPRTGTLFAPFSAQKSVLESSFHVVAVEFFCGEGSMAVQVKGGAKGQSKCIKGVSEGSNVVSH